MHVHVHAPSGEAKFWLEPRIELAQTSFGDLTKIKATPRPQRTASDATNQGQQQNDQRRPTNPFGPITK